MIFPNLSTPLVKLDLTFEAGSRYQPQPCVAHAASRLIGEATAAHSATSVAEFLDFRGIVVERSADVCTSCLSFYFLRRYAAELLPLVREMVENPLLTPQMFTAFVSKRRQQLETNALKTSQVARNIFYERLFGADHPMGVYARPEDVDRLTPQMITDFWRDRYQSTHDNPSPKYWITLSGHVDDNLLTLINDNLNENENQNENQNRLPPNSQFSVLNSQFSIDSQISRPSVQSSLRVGRVLPFQWNDPDPSKAPAQFSTLNSQFSILNTLLGGYFSSRLMSNLREDKGYTYGINSQVQIFRGPIVFFITADVANDAVPDALVQIDNELRRLQEERVSDEELHRVCTYMRGDHLRSIDGIFELAERHRQMATMGIDKRFFDYLLQALETTTPDDIQRLARRFLSPEEMLHVVVGPGSDC